MTIKQAIKVLIRTNKWRRGAEIEMPDVTEFGEAIDIAIAVMGAMLVKEPWIADMGSKWNNLE